MWHGLPFSVLAFPVPGNSVLLSIHRWAHNTWNICRESRIPWLQRERQGSDLPHLDTTTRHSLSRKVFHWCFQWAAFFQADCAEWFSRLQPCRISCRKVPSCGQVWNPDCTSLHTPARQSPTTETPAARPIPPPHGASDAILHYKRFVRVPDFLGSLGDSLVASYLIFFGAQLLVFFTTNTIWLNQSSEIGENKTNPQLNTPCWMEVLGVTSQSSHCWQSPCHAVCSKPSLGLCNTSGMERSKGIQDQRENLPYSWVARAFIWEGEMYLNLCSC